MPVEWYVRLDMSEMKSGPTAAFFYVACMPRPELSRHAAIARRDLRSPRFETLLRLAGRTACGMIRGRDAIADVVARQRFFLAERPGLALAMAREIPAIAGVRAGAVARIRSGTIAGVRTGAGIERPAAGWTALARLLRPFVAREPGARGRLIDADVRLRLARTLATPLAATRRRL